MTIPKVHLSSLTTAQRADAIYRSATADARARLWDAALGNADGAEDRLAKREPKGPQNLFDMLKPSARRYFEPPPNISAPPVGKGPHRNRAPAPVLPPRGGAPLGSPLDPNLHDRSDLSTGNLSLGVNAKFASALEGAAARTGVSSAALAAIVDAEAAKKRDGSWNPASRNPRSTAAGLTQFLSSTWIGEAERTGTFLNGLAKANGWLNSHGKIRAESRDTVLSLRLDARCAIEAAADYAKANVAHLQRSGIKIDENPNAFARAAYLGHHLGVGDAVDFLKGAISPARARKLLSAQVGGHEAKRRIEAAGCPTLAHRNWLSSYMAANITLSKFVAHA